MALKVGELFAVLKLNRQGFDRGLNEAERSFSSTGRELTHMSKTTARNVGRHFTEEMKEAFRESKKALEPFKRQMAEVEYQYFKMAQGMKDYKGSTKQFISAVEEMGKKQKKINDEMMKNNDFMKTGFIQNIGAMLARSNQSEKIAENFDRMNNPLYKVNKALLGVTNRLEEKAKKGQAAYLALKMLGPTANMKALRDMTMLINAGLMRMQMVALAAGIASIVLYGALHKAAMETPAYSKSFEKMLKTMRKAFQPMVDVFTMVMIGVYNFITAIGELMIKFNEAHPLIAKMLQGFLMLIPALTLILAPLAIGIGLVNGFAAAWAATWLIIKPLVIGLATMSATVWIVAAAIVGLTVGLNHLWKTNDKFRNGVIKGWDTIKQKAVEVFGMIIPPLLATLSKAFDTLSSAISKAFSGDFTELKEIFTKIAPIIVGAILGGIPAIIIAASRYLPAITEGINSNMPMILEVINNVITTLVTLFTESLPQLVAIGLKILGSIIQGIAEALPVVLPQIVSTITGMINLIIEQIGIYVPILLEQGVTILMAIINGIVANLPLVITAIIGIINTFTNTIAEWLPVLIDAGLKILTAVLEGIMLVLPQLIDTTILIITSMVNLLIENLPLLLDAGIKILLAVVDGIIQMLPQLIDAAIQLLNAITDTVIENLPKIIDAGVEILNALIDGIVEVLPLLIDATVKLIVEIAGAIVDNLPQIMEAGNDILQALMDGIQELVGELLTSIAEIGVAMITEFSNIDLFDIGADIIGGLISGLGSMGKAISDKVASLAALIPDGLKKFLGIASPAKVIMRLMKWVPIGAAKAIEGGSGLVARASKGMAKMAVPNLSGMKLANMNPSGAMASGGGMGAAGAGVTFNITGNTFRNRDDIDYMNQGLANLHQVKQFMKGKR